MFIIFAWWNVWEGYPEYQWTSAHCYLLLTAPVGRSSRVTRTSLGVWEQSLLGVQTPFAAQCSDKSNPRSHQVQLISAKSYSRWLVALQSHLRLRQWQENCILCSINLLEPWAHPFWLICWVLSSSYNRHRSWFSPFPCTALIHSASRFIPWSEGGRPCAEHCLWTRATIHNKECSEHTTVKLQEE